MADHPHRLTPYALSGPALLFYGLLLGVPLLSTLLLSLRAFDAGEATRSGLSLTHYLAILSDPYFHAIFARTFMLSAMVALLCVLIGTPEAYILSRMRAPWRSLFLIATLGPFLISVVVRTLGWAVLLGGQGVLSTVLQALGLADGPVSLLYTMPGMIIALVHVLVPFAVISVWVSLQNCDPDVERAGASLGASEAMIFRRLVLPQIVPGIVSGSVIAFSLAATAFATPSIIGGRRLKVVATAVYDAFFGTLDWSTGATLAILLLLANLLIVMSYHRLVDRRHRARHRVPTAALQEVSP
ncbi:ABC transporter permease [Paraburkholderia aspalathi]|uniref:Putative spermidine/putrescine transport system permease protein n=1 Tax=Paraburkholderia aspalathi TaxID=1324617 RepID=A0A1I7AAI3_9BURK|nr:ABC transporter permease [Paraburkholderia aspalathi]SFT71939.1 putative spermidine/putrescine transport system permease protein [Paraburkholderia aspalathi]